MEDSKQDILDMAVGSEPTVEDNRIKNPFESNTSSAMAKIDHEPVTEDKISTNDKNQDTFHGWMTTSATSPMTYQSFHPKTWAETDVDIAITHCGVCASDLHTMRSGWGETLYPCTLGHEIVGHIIRIGNAARPGLALGARVGVGPQCYTCRQEGCTPCSTGHENYCPRRVGTYGDRYPDGSISYGGFADVCRHDSYSVYSIPEGLASEDAAVMLCAGATVYEPLVEYVERKAGKAVGVGAYEYTKVGIIGLGGLGHLGVLFAKALGYHHVTALSRSESKRADALALGADSYMATSDELAKDWASQHASSLDLIISTVSDPSMPLQDYLTLLKPRGQFCQVGIPEEPLPQLDTMALVLNGTTIAFSDSASPRNVISMLDLAAEKGVKAWTQIRGMDEVNAVVQDMAEGKARFRFVLENKRDAVTREHL